MALKAFESESVNRQLISDALVKIFNAEEHPGVVEVFDFDLASPQAYMATALHGEHFQNNEGEEAVRPRTIEGLLGHLHEDDAWLYVRQISDALAYLHKLRVVHGNLEPGNVLLDGSTPPHVKLTDFSQGLVGAVTKVIPGHSVFYAAPEQIRQPEHYFGGRGERWDVYAFGALAYQLLTGQYPRLRRAIEEIKKREAAALDVHFNYDYRVLADMLEKEEVVEWPTPAADDDEAARRAIIDRCLQLAPEDRFADMREVTRAFESIDEELERREEHRKIAEAQVNADKKIAGTKKVTAILGALAIAGLCGTAYFGQKWSSVRNKPPTTQSPTKGSPGDPPQEVKTVIDTDQVDALKAQLGETHDSLREAQSALDDIFVLVAARNADGTSRFNLPEHSLGSLLSYYEEFAAKHADDPDLALEVARAESSAGEINLIELDGHGALKHLESAAKRMESVVASTPVEDNGMLVYTYASTLRKLSEAQAMVGMNKAAVDSASEAQRLWENLSQRNASSDFATRGLAVSLLHLGERLLDLDRAAETGMQAQRAKTLLAGLEEKNQLSPDDIIALAEADHLLGKAERSNGNLSDAVSLQIAATERLLDLKIADVEESDALSSKLATYYGETADTLAEDGNRPPATEANEEAIRILLELVEENGDNTSYHMQLSSRFGTRAAILRDEGKGTEARAAQNKSISILRDLLKVHPERNDIKFQLAMDLGDLMDLNDDANLKQDALDAGGEAKNIMNKLLQTDLDTESNNSKRSIYRQGFADILIRLAGHAESYKMKAEVSIDLYTKASNQLRALIAGGSSSDEVKEALEEANGRIKALGGTVPE